MESKSGCYMLLCLEDRPEDATIGPHDRYFHFFEIRLRYLRILQLIDTDDGSVINTTFDSEIQIVVLKPIHISESSSPESLELFVRESFQGLLQVIGGFGVTHIHNFLSFFTERFELDNPFLAVAEITLYDQLWSDNAANFPPETLDSDPDSDPDSSDDEDAAVDMNRHLQDLRTRLTDKNHTDSSLKLITYADGERDSTCTVCFGNFTDAEEIVKTSCSHSFHEKCIGMWTAKKSTCPNFLKILS